jgi:hypothetical protein
VGAYLLVYFTGLPVLDDKTPHVSFSRLHWYSYALSNVAVKVADAPFLIVTSLGVMVMVSAADLVSQPEKVIQTNRIMAVQKI